MVHYFTHPNPRAPRRPFPQARRQPVWRAERNMNYVKREKGQRTPLADFFNILLGFLGFVPHSIQNLRNSFLKWSLSFNQRSG